MKPPQLINVVGIDPSLRNWGLASGTLNLNSLDLQISRLELINPVLPTGKQVRQNSVDLISAAQLYADTWLCVQDAKAVFVEVPSGSQNARGMASYGICIGILGALRASGIPFYEVTPTEVKLAGAGSKLATKTDMIKWAMQAHPEGNWPTYQQKGQTLVSEAKAEHLADAIGAIYAGIKTNLFQQVLAMRALA